MQPLPHTYAVVLGAGVTGAGCTTAPGVPPIRVDAPAQFDGRGDAWSPEQLLLGAVASCFMLTFRAVARARRLSFLDLEVQAHGTVAKDEEGVVRFVDIVMRPVIDVAPGTDRALVLDAVARAEARCLVSASLRTPVHVEADVRETATAAIAACA